MPELIRRWSVTNIVHFQLCTQQIGLDYRNVCRHTHKGGQRASRKPISIVRTAVRKLWDRTLAFVGNWGHRKFWVGTLGLKNKISHSVCPVASFFKLCHRHQSKFVYAKIFTHPLYMSMKSVHWALECRQIAFIHAYSKEIVNIIVCCGGLFGGPWPKLHKQLTILTLPHKVVRQPAMQRREPHCSSQTYTAKIKYHTVPVGLTQSALVYTD